MSLAHSRNGKSRWLIPGLQVASLFLLSCLTALLDKEVEVTVTLRYIPPTGIVGDIFAAIFSDPETKLAEDLRNFKRYIEK